MKWKEFILSHRIRNKLFYGLYKFEWERNMKILVIVPAFNESESIENVVEMLQKLGDGIDYLVVNDCSTDNEEEVLLSIPANHIVLPVNLGIGGAVQAGYQYAVAHDYDIAIQIDGDGQHDPTYISDLIRPVIDGEADMAIGSRFITKEGFQSTGLRRTGITILSALIRLVCGVKVYDVTSGFRATNRYMTKVFADDYAQDFPEPEAIVACVMHGGRVKEVPVVMREREAGTSSIHSFKSVYYMIKVSLAVILKRFTTKRGGKKE